jgi:hypothetical protein
VSFNRVRSNIKVKEYSASGVPWLASPIGPYKGLGEEQGGRLVPNHGWAEALTDLVTDAPGRAALAERAAVWGRSQTVTNNVAEWEAVFALAAERAGRVPNSSLASADRSDVVAEPTGARGRTIVPRPIRPVDGPSRDGSASPGNDAGSRPRRGLFRRRAGR